MNLRMNKNKYYPPIIQRLKIFGASGVFSFIYLCLLNINTVYAANPISPVMSPKTQQAPVGVVTPTVNKVTPAVAKPMPKQPLQPQKTLTSPVVNSVSNVNNIETSTEVAEEHPVSPISNPNTDKKYNDIVYKPENKLVYVAYWELKNLDPRLEDNPNNNVITKFDKIKLKGFITTSVGRLLYVQEHKLLQNTFKNNTYVDRATYVQIRNSCSPQREDCEFLYDATEENKVFEVAKTVKLPANEIYFEVPVDYLERIVKFLPPTMVLKMGVANDEDF